MTRKAIVAAASKLDTTQNLLALLNKIKKDELGDRAHSFTMKQLNYFINPKRNRASYHTFTIPKKSGGVRTISAPVGMLRSFLTYTNVLLQAFYDAPECVTGFVPAKSVVDNAERHVGMNYVFNTDLKDFFPSISKSRVWATLKKEPFGFNDTIADAIAGLCCTYVNHEREEDNVALPQGSPCSPILTNIVCRNLDRRLSGLAKRFGLTYSRYADDITFSSMHNVYQPEGDFITELRRIVTGQHLTLNEKKTRLQKKGERQDVTGLVVNGGVNVTREYVRDLENLLYIWKKHGRASAFAKFAGRYVPKQSLRAARYDMERVVAGRLAYLKMVKGEESPVWRRLQKRYNALAGKKEKTAGTDIQYLNFYTLRNFVNLSGAELGFGIEDGKAVAFFWRDGIRTDIAISRYVRTRLLHVLETGSEKELEKFGQKYILAYCRSHNSCFWLIIRGMPKQKDASVDWTVHSPSETVPAFDDVDSYESTVMPRVDLEETDYQTGPYPASVFHGVEIISEKTPREQGKSTDEILKELVKTKDLKILDQWDKIKNNW